MLLAVFVDLSRKCCLYIFTDFRSNRFIWDLTCLPQLKLAAENVSRSHKGEITDTGCQVKLCLVSL